MEQIVHIPDIPSIHPDQQPTVDVIALFIDPKVANTPVRLYSIQFSSKHVFGYSVCPHC